MARDKASAPGNFAHMVGSGEYGLSGPAPHHALAAGIIGAMAVIIVATIFLAAIL